MSTAETPEKIGTLLAVGRIALCLVVFVVGVVVGANAALGLAALVLPVIGYLGHQIGIGFWGVLALGMVAALGYGLVTSLQRRKQRKEGQPDQTGIPVIWLLILGVILAIGAEGWFQFFTLWQSFFGVMADLHRAAAADADRAVAALVGAAAALDGAAALDRAAALGPSASARQASRLAFMDAFGGMVGGEVFIAAFLAIVSFPILAVPMSRTIATYKDFPKFRKVTTHERLQDRTVRIGIAICAVISVVVGIYCYGYVQRVVYVVAMLSVVQQTDALHAKMVDDYNAHHKNLATGVLVPNRAISDYGTALGNVRDLRHCSPEFQQAFRNYTAAWADFGSYVEQNSGLPGISRAYMTGGASLLEAWLDKIPAKVNAVKNAEQEMERVAQADIDRLFAQVAPSKKPDK